MIPEQHLTELNRRLGEAEQQRLETYLSELMADDLVFRRANGDIANKQDYLQGIRDPANTYSRLESFDIEPKIKDHVAVVTLRVDAAGVRGGKSFEGVFRNVRVFRKAPESKHGWQCYVWINTKESRTALDATDGRDEELAKEARAFLLKDYELRIDYLTNHFSRMWMRFNFFVTIQSALLGSKFLIGDGKFTPGVVGLGVVLSLVWYLCGAEDRYLVLIYRQQVKDAADQIGSGLPKPYEYVGQVDDLCVYPPANPLEWRWPFISTTRLAALIPLLALTGWLLAFVWMLPRW